MNDLSTIKTVLRKNKRSLVKEFKVKELGIFGSYARGEQKKRSDIDILIAFSRTPGFFDFLKLEERLGKLLKGRVDLVMKGSLKPFIGKNVMREVIYI